MKYVRFAAPGLRTFSELRTLAELTFRAGEHERAGDGRDVEPLEENVVLQQEGCRGAPFYTFGPLTTDIAVGYNYITSDIGAAAIANVRRRDALLRRPEGAPGLPNRDALYRAP